MGSAPPKLSPGLYIVATPIGNLGDLSDRARATLAAADLVACEDTRVTGKLLHLIGIKRPLVRHDDHSDDAARAALIARMASEAVVLVSDAGTPLVSDPGYRLVRDARAAGVAVHGVPGPAAPILALVLSGLPSDRFLFAGFLPAKAKARDEAIAELAGLRATLILFESGQRLGRTLAALASGLGAREAAVARELTKLHEEVVTGTLAELAQRYADVAPKGEVTLVIGPPGREAAPAAADAATLDAALTAALADASPARAAKAVAAQLGVPRALAYARAVELAQR